ncbi:MAG: sodium:solute symporter family protein [Planctomycetaceae bacterium]|nr:sodium:solute symporter family protein [Planctomycetaceae bacterium]
MSYLGLHWEDWVVLGFYLIGITLIGVWSYRQVHNVSDFFMGGRRFGKIFMMFFAFGAGTSSEQAVSVSAGGFRNGLAGIWYQFLWLWATPFYWIIAPVFRRMRALTTSDFFEARYDQSTALLYCILGILMSITFIAGSLFGGAQMVVGLAGGINPETGAPYFPPEYAVGAMTIMFILYGFAGGLNAAVITDFIQGVLTIIFSFLLLPFALSVAAEVVGTDNGFAAIRGGVPGRDGAQMLSLTMNSEVALRLKEEPITPFYILMLSLTGLVGIVVQPHIMGVCGAGKTEFEGRFGFTVGNFLKRLCTIAWVFTGLACVIIYLAPESPYMTPDRLAQLQADSQEMTAFSDQIFGRAAHDILPTIAPGLVGLLFASLLAAIMSTCDAQMVVGSGLFTENIYRRYIVKNASPTHYVWVGRFAGLAIVAAAIIMMGQFENVIHALTGYILAVATFMGLSFWFGITWRGFTPKAVWASTLATFAVWYLTHKHTPFGWLAALGETPALQQNIDYLPSLFREWLWDLAPITKSEVKNATSVPWQILMYLSAGAVTGILVSLLTKRTPEDKLDHFYKLIRTPIRPGEEVKEPCTLPDDHLPTETGKLIPWKDLEIPRPSFVGTVGFLVSWGIVALIVGVTYGLARLG